MAEGFRTVRMPGATVAIVNRGRVLLLKRINLPFLINRGAWYFVGGGRKRGESLLGTAYREVQEETGIRRKGLTLLADSDVVIQDRRKRMRWANRLFVMRASDDRVRLNIENRDYRWVRFSDLRRCEGLLGTLEDSGAVLRLIGRHAAPGRSASRA
jgi:8-oxo-dGTP pyrophosphatase MutT (NUDIX family)